MGNKKEKDYISLLNLCLEVIACLAEVITDFCRIYFVERETGRKLLKNLWWDFQPKILKKGLKMSLVIIWYS